MSQGNWFQGICLTLYDWSQLLIDQGGEQLEFLVSCPVTRNYPGKFKGIFMRNFQTSVS